MAPRRQTALGLFLGTAEPQRAAGRGSLWMIFCQLSRGYSGCEPEEHGRPNKGALKS